MSRLKRPIQTAKFLRDAHCAGLGGPFKQKRNFGFDSNIVASPHALTSKMALSSSNDRSRKNPEFPYAGNYAARVNPGMNYRQVMSSPIFIF
jgi:hypothetical protein